MRRGAKGLNYRYDPRKVWARIIYGKKGKNGEKVQLGVVDAGGKAITMYGMRHTFASHYMANTKVKDSQIAHWLGHANTKMLYKHYGHLRSYSASINAGLGGGD